MTAAPVVRGNTEPRARDLGVAFDGTPAPLNAITDVAGVEVGYKTLISGEGRLVIGKGPVRTGVTAILPRGKQGTKSSFAGLLRRERKWRYDRHALDRRERSALDTDPHQQHGKCGRRARRSGRVDGAAETNRATSGTRSLPKPRTSRSTTSRASMSPRRMLGTR